MFVPGEIVIVYVDVSSECVVGEGSGLVVRLAVAAVVEDSGATLKVTTPPSPSAAEAARAADRRLRTTSSVLDSRSCRAEAEVRVGRTVAAWGRTVSAGRVGVSLPLLADVLGCVEDEVRVVAVPAAPIERADDGSWERAFFDVGFVGGGKIASKMAAYGGWASVVGMVKSGVSHLEKGEGGS
jgi:hypothetical protein